MYTIRYNIKKVISKKPKTRKFNSTNSGESNTITTKSNTITTKSNAIITKSNAVIVFNKCFEKNKLVKYDRKNKLVHKKDNGIINYKWYQHILLNLDNNIMKLYWLNTLNNNRCTLDQIPKNVVGFFDQKIIDEYCLNHPTGFNLENVPLPNITTTIIFLYCYHHVTKICRQLSLNEIGYDIFMNQSIGNVTMCILFEFRKQFHRLISYEMILKYDVFVDQFNRFLSKGQHRNYFTLLPFELRTKLFKQIICFNLHELEDYQFDYHFMNTYLKHHKKSLYLKLKNINDFEILRKYPHKILVRNSNLLGQKILILDKKKKTILSNHYILDMNNQLRIKNEVQANMDLFLELGIPQTEQVIIHNEIITLDTFEINIIKQKFQKDNHNISFRMYT
jgi:hypothetical protein